MRVSTRSYAESLYTLAVTELDQFVKTDEFGQFLRDKAIARLPGTLPENDGNL